MSESFAVKSSLTLSTNIPEVMRGVGQAFENIDSLIRSAKESLSLFSTDMRALVRNTGGLGVLSDAMTKLSNARVNEGVLDDMSQMISYADQLSASQDRMTQAARETADAWRQAAEASRAASAAGGGGGSGSGALSAPPPRRERGHSFLGLSHGEAMDAAFGLQMAGGAGTNLAEQGFMAQAEVQRQIILLQADKRVTSSVIAKLQAQIATLQKTNPALRQLEGLQLFGENMGVFGNTDEALATLPGSVRLQQLYELSSTGKGGTGGDENLAAMKAGDAMQSFINPKTKQIDVDLFNRWIEFQTKSVLAGGGIVDAKSWLTFARTARAAGISMNQDALEYTQALLELSPGRTGTALQSAFQLFGASTATLSDKHRAAWQDVGLIDKAGKLSNAAAYQDDPYTWVWNTLLPDLAKHGIRSRQQILAWLSANGQRATVAGVLADIAISETNIQKTKARFDAQDPNTVSKLQDSDIGKLQALYTAENNFLIALGKFEEGPGVAILTGLTNALNGITAWAEANPGTAKAIALTGVGLAFLAKAVGDVAFALILAMPVLKAARALGTGVGTKIAGSGGAAAGAGAAGSGAGKAAATAAKGGALAGVAEAGAIATALIAGGWYSEQVRNNAFAKMFPNDPAGQVSAEAGGVVTPATMGDPHKSGGQWGKLDELWNYFFGDGKKGSKPDPADQAMLGDHIGKQVAAALGKVTVVLDGQKVGQLILNGAADQASRTPPSTGRYDSRMQMLHPSIAT